MSFRVGNLIVIAPEEPEICAFCGAKEELRPYGPNDERICYKCAMMDEKTAKRKMLAYLLGEQASPDSKKGKN